MKTLSEHAKALQRAMAESKGRLADLLATIDPAKVGYSEWLAVGRAVHAILPSADGLDIFKKWSAQSPRYAHGRAGAVWGSWNCKPMADPLAVLVELSHHYPAQPDERPCGGPDVARAVADMVAMIDPDKAPRGSWAAVAWALRSLRLDHAGLSIFEQWAAPSSKYEQGLPASIWAETEGMIPHPNPAALLSDVIDHYPRVGPKGDCLDVHVVGNLHIAFDSGEGASDRPAQMRRCDWKLVDVSRDASGAPIYVYISTNPLCVPEMRK